MGSIDEDQYNERRAMASLAAILAGKEIMEVYNSSDFNIEIKDDNSPLTRADKAADHVIGCCLGPQGIPILSEEDVKHASYEQRKKWKQCWIVDPLDGTKEFIKRNGEFTVNIALVENGEPIFGIVYAPALGLYYCGEKGKGAYRIDVNANPKDHRPKPEDYLPLQALPSRFTIVGSRSHSSPETEAFVKEMEQKHGAVDFIAAGSSLKFCLVAEGKAHAYPRFAPTMEWDTAAGQAILEAAGGTMVQWPSKEKFTYNREELRNGWFLATAENRQ